jgi:hypothetical protein
MENAANAKIWALPFSGEICRSCRVQKIRKKIHMARDEAARRGTILNAGYRRKASATIVRSAGGRHSVRQ